MSYTAEELAALREERGENIMHLDDTTAAKRRAADPDAEETFAEWDASVSIEMPKPKKQVTLRVDADVVDWFKGQGQGHYTRMSAVLRSYMLSQKER